jgi:tetratricopeptide (TPR) repeat protein
MGILCSNAIMAQSAESYLESGQSKMRSRDISGALVDFNVAISINPDYELAYVNRGLCRMAQGNWAKAIPDCNKAIALNPNQAVAYFVRKRRQH